MMRGRTPQSLPAEMLLAVGFSGLQQARTQGESINLIIKDHHLEPRVLTLLCNWLGRMGPSVRDLRLDTDAAPSTPILVAANGRTALGFCRNGTTVRGPWYKTCEVSQDGSRPQKCPHAVGPE